MFTQNTPLHRGLVWQLAEMLYLLKQKRNAEDVARFTFTEICHLDISEYLDLMHHDIWIAIHEIQLAETLTQWITDNGGNDNVITDATYNQVGEKHLYTLQVTPNITFHLTQEGEKVQCLTLYGDEYTWYSAGEHEFMYLIKKEKE